MLRTGEIHNPDGGGPDRVEREEEGEGRQAGLQHAPVPDDRLTLLRERDASERNPEDRWDEAADPPLDVVAYSASLRARAHGRDDEGQPWSMLASICTSRKAGSACSRRRAR